VAQRPGEAAPRIDVRLVSAAAVAWAVTAAGIAWDIGPLLAAMSATIGLGWVLACHCFGDGRPVLRAAAAGVLGAAVVGAGFGAAVGLRSDAVRQHPLASMTGSTAWVTVAAAESARPSGPGRLMFRARLIRVADAAESGAVVVFAPAVDFGQWSAGQPARFRARIARPARRDLTVAALTAVGRPEFGRLSVVQGIALSVRTRFAAVARRALPAEQSAILPGLVLGDTAAVPPALTADFRIAGLTHLTAVSGANVTIVCGAVLLSGYLLGPRPAVALAALSLVALVVVVQPTASVLRAAIMGAIGLLALLSGRTRQAIPALGATVIAVMVSAPQLAVDVGFALSVSATAGLVLLVPGWAGRLIARGGRRPVGHRATDRRDLRTVLGGVGTGESRCGAGYSADHCTGDHGCGHRGVLAVGGRPAGPVHRSGAVFAASGGARDRRGARCVGTGALRVGGRADAGGRRRGGGGRVAAAVGTGGRRDGRAGRRGVVGVGSRHWSVTPSGGERCGRTTSGAR
jgi:competence protein ComEC